jgi:hypothetical protein
LLHELLCQAPLTHVCVSVPQLPHGTGFVCPGAHTLQAPALHTLPEPQLAPSAALVHAEVLVPGVQISHPLLFVALGA